jgi:hypothetical protein
MHQTKSAQYLTSHGLSSEAGRRWNPIRDPKNPNRAAAYLPSLSRGEGMPFMFKLPGVSMSIGMIIAIAAQATGRIISGPRTSREPSITRASRPSRSDIIDGPMAPKRMAPSLTCAKPAKRSSRAARIPRGRGTSHIDLPAAGALSCYALTRAPDDGGIRRRQDTDMNITRAIAVVACSLGLAACSSSLMGSELFSSKPATATLTIESDPPGADASVSTGASCRTPCSLAAPVADALTVSYELTGYLPQTVPVRPLPGESGLFGSSGTATQFDPNPVFAALQPATPSKPPPPKKRKRPTTAAAPPPTAPPPSMGGLAPPPGIFTPMIR